MTIQDPTAASPPDPSSAAGGVLAEVQQLDVAIYGAIASTPTPSLDRAMRALASAADYSRLSIATAAGMALTGGPSGRRAAIEGLAAVSATSAVVNLLIKPVSRRRRPDREGASVPVVRHVPMPASRSFPSGHAAAAFAFAAGASRPLPSASPGLHALAALVSYSRIHTGVHFPGDVVAGALIGAVVADVTGSILGRRLG